MTYADYEVAPGVPYEHPAEPNIYARVIADSASPEGSRVITIEAQMHRYVLAELNTHRVFSRNSASSRAIPLEKRIQAVVENPAMPLEWGSNQAGMQAGEELTGDALILAQEAWLDAKDDAVERAKTLLALGVHKQVANRILEPFVWHKVVITSSRWQNFFDQRVSPLAQPEIRAVAEMMKEAVRNSVPQPLDYGQWHLPYVLPEEVREFGNEDKTLRQVSSARCARTSYNNFDGTRDVDKDVGLFEKLRDARPMHASPLEHPCSPTAASDWRCLSNLHAEWVQYRHIVEVEADLDSTV